MEAFILSDILRENRDNRITLILGFGAMAVVTSPFVLWIPLFPVLLKMFP